MQHELGYEAIVLDIKTRQVAHPVFARSSSIEGALSFSQPHREKGGKHEPVAFEKVKGRHPPIPF
jgi:hypothetical protein